MSTIIRNDSSYYYNMIEKVGDVWSVKCDMCDWNIEVEDELSARGAYNRHIKEAHGQDTTKIKEGQGTAPDEKQPPLPGPIAPQGKEKEHK